MAEGITRRMGKVRFLALLLCVAMLCSVFPENGASAKDVGKKEGTSAVPRVITYDKRERLLSGDIAVAASGTALEASACTLVFTKEEPAFAIGATFAAVDASGVSGIRMEGEDITITPEEPGYRISFAKRDVEQPEISEGNILYWHKNNMGEYVYVEKYPAVVKVENRELQGEIFSDKKYVAAGSQVTLRMEVDNGDEQGKMGYEWFFVGKDGEGEEALGETEKECTVEVKQGINRFCCKVAVDGENYEDFFEIAIVGYAKKIHLQVKESISINAGIFGEKGGVGASPVSVQVKGSYKKKFQKKKCNKIYNTCLKWEKKNPDKIQLKKYCECGNLVITMPGKQEGETETFSVKLEGSLVLPAYKFNIKMAKDRKSLTAIYKNVKGMDKIQFALGKKGKIGKRWKIDKEKEKKIYRVGYSQKNGKKIKEKVFFGRIGVETAFGIKYSDWKSCRVKAKKAKKK